MTTLPSITREYTLYEIAMMSRAGAAKLFGFTDRGQLGAGAVADVAVYKPQTRHGGHVPPRGARVQGRRTRRARRPRSRITRAARRCTFAPITIAPIDRRLDSYYDDLYGLPRCCSTSPTRRCRKEDAFAEVPCRS